MADAQGLAAVSMRRIAARLGCTTMSLYRYVPGKAELLDLMTDAVMGEVPPADAAPGDWRTRLELSARADWGLYHRHPWIRSDACRQRAYRACRSRRSRPA
ncbi:TetR/AcrR family transcriptional regulator [Streptomyces iranensis]|uniref:TetR/AcrR family transcriptional regulator n=1 Tax=Streptomyces iranensis TaxID=576784 RepID=UPI0036D3E555